MSSRLQKWSNWEGNQQCMAEIYRAYSIHDLVQLVQKAAKEGKTIRVASGARDFKGSASYSASAVVNNEGNIIVHIPGLNKGYVHADGSHRITAEAGMTLGELEALARQHELCFETMPVPESIQVGGAVALANHGVWNHGGTLSDLVVGMEILLCDGSIQKITEDEPELLKAARVSLGVLGIIIKVTFQCVPLFKLETVDEKVDLAATIDNMAAIIAAHDYVDLFWFPYTKKLWLKRWKKVPDDTPLQNVPGMYARNREWLAFQASIIGMELMIRLNRLTPLLFKLLLLGVEQKRRVAYPQDIYHYQRYFPRKLHDLSYNLDVGENFEHFKQCFYHMMNTIEGYAKPKKRATSPWPWHYKKGGRFPQKFVTHIRFIKSSEAYLSPANGHRFSVYLEALTYFGADYQEYYHALEQYWLTFGAKPHWGKTFREDQDFENIFGDDWRRFNTIRRQMDPHGLFLNPFMEHVFKVATRQQHQISDTDPAFKPSNPEAN